jgi:Ni/Co efflux regulator RcnB
MKKIVLGLAGASVALGALAATPASAADFRGQDRGRFEQVQSRNAAPQRNFAQNRNFTQNRNFSQNRFVTSRYTGFDKGSQARQWQRGDRFDSRYATDYGIIDNPGYYNLGPAPYGYRWVRSGDDAVLVAIASGLIGALVANSF